MANQPERAVCHLLTFKHVLLSVGVDILVSVTVGKFKIEKIGRGKFRWSTCQVLRPGMGFKDL